MKPSRFFMDVGAFLRGIGRKTEDLEAASQQMTVEVNKALSASAYQYVVTTGSNGRATLDYSSLSLPSAPGGIVITPELAEDQLPVSFDIVGVPTASSCVVRARRLTSVLNLGLLSSYTAVPGVKLRIVVRPS